MKFTPGPLLGQASGSIGGTTFSRNRYGMYTRNKAIPTNPNTVYQIEARSRLSDSSQHWQTLDADEKDAWITYADGNPITDVLGQAQVLSGHAMCVQINSRRLINSVALLDLPPIFTIASPLLTLALEADIGAGDTEINFTPTPLEDWERMWVFAAVVDSPGVSYVENLYKLVMTGSLADTSPVDIEASVITRFGALIEGQTLHVKAIICSENMSNLSAPLKASALVVST